MGTRSKEYDHFLKFVIIGDSSVGKSCLLLRFADDQFTENHMATIGVDFRFKTVKSQNKNVKLQIWDTAGQERFRTITNTYYKSANAVIMVYDITSLESFESIQNYWLDEVENYADPDVTLILVGNKSDKRENQAVNTENAKEFARQKGMLFLEASAKTAEQVNESFMGVTHSVLNSLGKEKTKNKTDIGKKMELAHSRENNKPQGSCCY